MGVQNVHAAGLEVAGGVHRLVELKTRLFWCRGVTDVVRVVTRVT